jgi:hypothetical protein
MEGFIPYSRRKGKEGEGERKKALGMKVIHSIYARRSLLCKK